MNLRSLHSYTNNTAPYLAPGLLLLILPVTHTVALRLLLLLITLVMAAVAFAKGDRSRPPCLIAWALWLGVALFSLTTAVDPGYSLGEIKTEIGYGAIAFFAFYVLTRQWRDYQALVSVQLAGLWILSCAALHDSLATGYWQAEGFYGGMGDFSTYLLTLLPLLLLLAWHRYSNRAKLTSVLAVITVVLVLFTAFMTQNLMVWICFAIQLLALLLSGMRGRVRMKLAIGLIAAFIALGALVTVGAQKGRVTSFSPGGIADMFVNDVRVRHWQNVLSIIRQRPFRGDGFGRAALLKAHPEVHTFPALWHSHNIFLDAAIQTGLQGALVLLLLFAGLAWRFNRLRRDTDRELHAIGVAGLVLLAGVLSKSMTDNFFYRHLSLLFWAETGMLLGLARGLLLQRKSGDVTHPAESSPAVARTPLPDRAAAGRPARRRRHPAGDSGA